MARRSTHHVLIAAVLLPLVLASCGGGAESPPFDPSKRPSKKELLFDNAHILASLEESCNRYLSAIRTDFGIEAIILTLPSLEGLGQIETVAAEVLSGWNIGRDFGGRGLLLLLVDDRKLVKLEVSYELEDVFTDLYTGFVEDRQLGPNFRDGELGIGLIAVMEEMELRAQLKNQGSGAAKTVEGRDMELLSGGAGAQRELTDEEGTAVSTARRVSPGAGGSTPGEAWEIMLSKWREEEAHRDRDIYTESTRMAMGDQNRPDSRTTSKVGVWSALQYEVIQEGDYAAISFGNVKGWDKAPWLFCRTEGGWKFDIVNQRKWVVMGRAPAWHVERADHPYVDLFSNFSYTMSKDIPLPAEDRYDMLQDEQIVERIDRLQNRFANDPGDFDAAMELGRLGTVTSMRPNKVLPALKRAAELDPQNPLPYKYMAIRNVEANFQYETALGEMSRYVELLPEDPFGYSFTGFLQFQVGRYDDAIKSFKKALSLNPDNCYAHCKISRSYAMRYLKAGELNPLRQTWKKRAWEHLELARYVSSPDQRRISWLSRWLKRKGLQ
jgi:uncharacterized membrane protein YgcG